MAKARNWTKEEDKELKYMKEKGTSVAVMARVLNRPLYGVSQRLWKLGYSTAQGEITKRKCIRRDNPESVNPQLSLLDKQERPRVSVQEVWVLSRRTKPSALSRAWHWLFGREWRSLKQKQVMDGE